MNDSALLNSYKCYDSIPTPSPTALDVEQQQQFQLLHRQYENQQQSKHLNDFMHQSLSANANGNIIVNQINSKGAHRSPNDSPSNLIRAASLDSLINSSEQDGGSGGSNKTDTDDDDALSDSDSLCELRHISCDSNRNNSDECPRKSDIEELKDVQPPREPVIKAYLEKCHKKCEVKNCCFKKVTTAEGEIEEIYNTKNNDNSNSNNSSQTKSLCKNQQQQQPVVKTNSTARRNSIASSISISRMETIMEEPPIEAKVSVKEILARFETLREAAEVKQCVKISSRKLSNKIANFSTRLRRTHERKTFSTNGTHLNEFNN
jgi:ribosomal protein S17E